MMANFPHPLPIITCSLAPPRTIVSMAINQLTSNPIRIHCSYLLLGGRAVCQASIFALVACIRVSPNTIQLCLLEDFVSWHSNMKLKRHRLTCLEAYPYSISTITAGAFTSSLLSAHGIHRGASINTSIDDRVSTNVSCIKATTTDVADNLLISIHSPIHSHCHHCCRC